MRVAAGVVGEPQDRLTMHSGRAGMTTLLATAGFDAAYIKEYGFWSTEAYEGYIRGTVLAGATRSRTTCPTATPQWRRC